MDTSQFDNSSEAQNARTVIFETMRDLDRVLVECAQSLEYQKVQEIREYRDRFFEETALQPRTLDVVEGVIEHLGEEAWVKHPDNAELAIAFTRAALHGPSLRSDQILRDAQSMDNLRQAAEIEDDSATQADHSISDTDEDAMSAAPEGMTGNEYNKALSRLHAGFYRLTLTVVDRMQDPDQFYGAMNWINRYQKKAMNYLAGAELDESPMKAVRSKLREILDWKNAPIAMRRMIDYDSLLPKNTDDQSQINRQDAGQDMTGHH